ncbi:type II toxin-antitoxin system VapB family antitoxin [Actinacidiphila glaucinigra]|uniref:type II toxin-antitoxin system VapB family antitoxin n=1 Tax=Actinacidiphila glaucinigra TaxID=235986 RepID=UPI0037192D18
MTRTVIDVDDQMPAEAAEIFGTTTKVATVNAALEDAIKRRKRASFLDWLADGGLPGLTGEAGAAHDPHRAA